MEGLNLDNILDDNSFNPDEELIFDDSENEEESDSEENLTIDDSDNEDYQESVDSQEENQEDTFEDDDEDSSPNELFYSSIASALSEEGILPDLDEETINNIQSAADLRNAINEQIQHEIGEVNSRIAFALSNGVNPDIVRQSEGILGFLSQITQDQLEDESDEGEELRKRLIYQDLLNRGYTEKKAEKEVLKSINSGTDIDDAKEALEANKQFYANAYNGILNEAKQQKDNYEKALMKQAKEFKDSIFDSKTKFFDEINPDKKTRQRIYDNIAKPVWKDERGQYLTEIQKYEREHPKEFKTAVSVLFTLTDQFKSLDNLVNSRVKKEVKKGFRTLESKINNSSRDTFGNLQFVGSNNDDSYSGKGLKFDF